MPFGCVGFDASLNNFPMKEEIKSSPMPFGCVGFDATPSEFRVHYKYLGVSNAFRLCGL